MAQVGRPRGPDAVKGRTGIVHHPGRGTPGFEAHHQPYTVWYDGWVIRFCERESQARVILDREKELRFSSGAQAYLDSPYIASDKTQGL